MQYLRLPRLSLQEAGWELWLQVPQAAPDRGVYPGYCPLSSAPAGLLAATLEVRAILRLLQWDAFRQEIHVKGLQEQGELGLPVCRQGVL